VPSEYPLDLANVPLFRLQQEVYLLVHPFWYSLDELVPGRLGFGWVNSPLNK